MVFQKKKINIETLTLNIDNRDIKQVQILISWV